MNDFERRIRKLAPVKREHVVMLMREQRQRLGRLNKRDDITDEARGWLPMSVKAYLEDAVDVQREGCTPLREVFDD